VTGPTIQITERGFRDHTSLGRVLQLKVFTPDYRPLGWREVWEAFAAAYPGRWAVQVFPPADRLVDGKSVYHLWLLSEAPRGLDLKAD
jgi:hypothetical protein